MRCGWTWCLATPPHPRRLWAGTLLIRRATTIAPVAVAKFPAKSVAVSVTENVSPLAGVTHSSLGFPPRTVALVLQTTRDPLRTVKVTFEIFESAIRTPPRVPPRSFVVSSAIKGGVFTSV